MERCFPFSSDNFTENEDIIEILGSRGRRVMELASLGAPISPGFIVPNALVTEIEVDEDQMEDLLYEHIPMMEKIMGKKFNDPENPLLIKALESPMLNMVDASNSIHNIGLVESTVDGFAKHVGEDFAYHEFKNVLRHIAELELKTLDDASRAKDLRKFADALKKAKTKSQVQTLLERNKALYPEKVYTSGFEQLAFVVTLFSKLFASHVNSNDSAVLVQCMVFGNYGEESLFGNFYTRHIVTGDKKLSGEFHANSFDDGVGEGQDINSIKPKYKKTLENIAKQMEEHFKEVRQIRFTIENGALWVIDQKTVPNKSSQAEIKTLLDLLGKKIVDDAYVINKLKPGRLAEILHPALELSTVKGVKTLVGGIAGAVGSAVGRVYFDTESLLKAHKKAVQAGEDTDFILIMPASFAEDVKGIEVANGVISSEGGYASHAPVVARSLGKVALVNPEIKFLKNSCKFGNITVKEGEYITMTVPYYEEPTIYFGKGSLVIPSAEGSGLLELLEVIQRHITDDFDVHANADQPRDAELAKKFLAQGIGLCRTEHMFFEEKRINIFRAMIIADNDAERKKALNKLQKMQRDDFYGLLKVMAGLPVTIRLMDAPLHEFMPHTRDTMVDFIKFMQKANPDLSDADVRMRCDMLNEFNPMLGHRGVRIAISYPEIYHMQIKAIFEAAYQLKSEGVDVHPEIMIPIVMSANELKTIRYGKKIEGKSIVGIREIIHEVEANFKDIDPVEYKVGSMIELPAAALQADKIACYAEFFSFGTNDLTQTTKGLSRDDFNNFFSDYNEYDLLENNPFKYLDPQVKELITIAAERGKITRPNISLGLCGEHGAEPENIEFVKSIGLDYVSCSPYGIPIAKLAIAQLNLKEQ